MFIKKSIIVLVLAALAQVCSVVGTASGAGNSTRAPFDVAEFDSLVSKLGSDIAEFKALLSEVGIDPSAPMLTSYGLDNLRALRDLPKLDITSDRLCLPTAELERAFESQLKIEKRETCLQVKERIFSSSPSVFRTENCRDHVRPICHDVHHAIFSCNPKAYVFLMELFRCQALKKIAISYANSEIVRNRFHKTNDTGTFLRMVNVYENLPEWKMTFHDLSLNVDHRCPLDCNEFLIQADSEERIVQFRDSDRFAVMASFATLQMEGAMSSFPYPTEQDALANAGNKTFSDIPLDDLASLKEKIRHCRTHDLTPLESDYCTDCAHEVTDRFSLPHYNVSCPELLLPFFKPSFACLMCGTCGQYANSVAIKILERHGCSSNFDDYSFSE